MKRSLGKKKNIEWIPVIDMRKTLNEIKKIKQFQANMTFITTK